MHMGCVCRGDMAGMGDSMGGMSKWVGLCACIVCRAAQMARIVQSWAEGGNMGLEQAAEGIIPFGTVRGS